MKILVINTGSSSIKYQLFESEGWQALAVGSVSRIGEAEAQLEQRWLDASGAEQHLREGLVAANHQQGLENIIETLATANVLKSAGELGAVGHRVVHGGERFHCPTLIDDAVVETVRATIPLAPLHNPANLDGIAVARRLVPRVPQVAVFDTAFHHTMPPVAYRYALPEALYQEYGVRRYGFHGTSHHYVAKRAAVLLGKPLTDCNLITLHLGNGASATAIRNGRSVDTSMGMTPLEGLVMGSRCGDIDPAIPFYLGRNAGLDSEQLDALLNRQSGLLGICGVNDMREIHRRADAGDQSARLAVDIFSHRLKKYLGAYYAELGRVDAVIFTGGIGENDAFVRAQACSGLSSLGILINHRANNAPESGERRISAADGAVQVLVIPTNEELEIARQTLETVAHL